MKRNDVHAPTNLVTEDYDFLALIDHDQNESTEGAATAERQAVMQSILAQGYRMASVHHAGQCDHCGSHLRYAALMLHKPSSTVIEVGETCLDNRFSVATAEFQKARKNAELARAKHRIVAARNAFVSENPDLAFLNTGEIPEVLDWCEFVHDIGRKLRTYGDLSDAQVSAVRKVYASSVKRESEKVAEIPESLADAPTGRVVVEGTVVSTKWQESQYGDTLKMLVKVTESDESTWKLWVSVPSSLHRDYFDEVSGAWVDMNVNRGDVVKIRVTVTPSDNDPSFAFGSRPTVVS